MDGREAGVVPSSAQGLDQADGRNEALTEKLGGEALVIKQRLFRRDKEFNQWLAKTESVSLADSEAQNTTVSNLKIMAPSPA